MHFKYILEARKWYSAHRGAFARKVHKLTFQNVRHVDELE